MSAARELVSAKQNVQFGEAKALIGQKFSSVKDPGFSRYSTEMAPLRAISVSYEDEVDSLFQASRINERIRCGYLC